MNETERAQADVYSTACRQAQKEIRATLARLRQKQRECEHAVERANQKLREVESAKSAHDAVMARAAALNSSSPWSVGNPMESQES